MSLRNAFGVEDLASRRLQHQKGSFQSIAVSFHFVEDFVGFIHWFKPNAVGEVLMASDRKSEVSRHNSPPALNCSLVWVLIEGAVNLYKIEDFRVSF